MKPPCPETVYFRAPEAVAVQWPNFLLVRLPKSICWIQDGGPVDGPSLAWSKRAFLRLLETKVDSTHSITSVLSQLKVGNQHAPAILLHLRRLPMHKTKISNSPKGARYGKETEMFPSRLRRLLWHKSSFSWLVVRTGFSSKYCYDKIVILLESTLCFRWHQGKWLSALRWKFPGQNHEQGCVFDKPG